MSINDCSSDRPQGLWCQQSMMDTTPKTPSYEYKGEESEANAYDPLWLGTFHSQEAASASYELAVPMLNATLNFQPNEEPITEAAQDDREEEEEERENMFEKPLTPSDVGKLNRLVIPKQHAEKYFPLGGSDSGEKGLLLNFEDESGKPWRFRYSYWNSSQSYVLTKGWSRFVKEKRLDAGDVVSFDRCRHDGQRLFIRWRRRAIPVQDSTVAQSVRAPTAAWTQQFFYSAHPYPSHLLHGPLLNQPDCLHAVEPVVQNPMITPGNSKRLRLFGVNLDCQLHGSEPVRPDGSSLASQGQAHFLYSHPHASNHDDSNKAFNFSRDTNHSINGPGDLSM